MPSASEADYGQTVLAAASEYPVPQFLIPEALRSRCAISGIAERSLLDFGELNRVVASHIILLGESVERRADPTNGLCLNALYDRAFDRGLMTIDERLRVRTSRRLREAVNEATLPCSLLGDVSIGPVLKKDVIHRSFALWCVPVDQVSPIWTCNT